MHFTLKTNPLRFEGDLRTKAKGIEDAAKKAYADAVAPYRQACRKAGVECEFAGGRAANVAPAVRFLIKKVKGGIKIAIRDSGGFRGQDTSCAWSIEYPVPGTLEWKVNPAGEWRQTVRFTRGHGTGGGIGSIIYSGPGSNRGNS